MTSKRNSISFEIFQIDRKYRSCQSADVVKMHLTVDLRFLQVRAREEKAGTNDETFEAIAAAPLDVQRPKADTQVFADEGQNSDVLRLRLERESLIEKGQYDPSDPVILQLDRHIVDAECRSPN